jgi:ATP-dependent helicase HrpB
MSLPIDKVMDELRAAMGARECTVLTAPTGSGKSTRVPGCMRDALGGPVLVLEPRRVACRSLATFVAEQAGTPLGQGVGYRVRFEDRSSEETSVLFVTPGVALRMLQGEGALPFAGVMLDEFHERSWQTDLALALLRRRQQTSERAPRIVVASATLEAGALAEQLDAATVEAEGRAYPVEVEHREEPGAPSGDGLEWRVADEVDRALGRDDAGDVLVFLPGKGEIDRAYDELRARGVEARAVLHKVHGGVSPRALVHAFAGGQGARVYLATNVAETSLTIPGVRTVVDSGLVRQKVHRAGRSVLALVAASGASLDQRAGRAGRVAPGRCVRLFSSRHRPEASTPPELSRVELDDLVLEAAACGLPASELEGAPFPTPPPSFAVERAVERLRARGALDAGGAVTEMGRRLARVPLDASDAAVVLDAPPQLAAGLCDLAALLDLDRDLLRPIAAIPAAAREDVELAREQLFGHVRSDVELCLLALRRGDARRHGLAERALVAARERSRSLRRLLQVKPALPEHDESPLPRADELAAHLLERLPQAGFVLRPRAQQPEKGRGRGRGGRGGASRMGEPWANGEVEVWVRPFLPPGAEAESGRSHAQSGVLLAHTWLEGGRRSATTGRGWLLLPCDKRVLARAHLGEERVAEPRLDKGGAEPRVVARVERVLADVVLSAEEEPLRGDALRRAAAELFVRGTLLGQPAAERVLDALHLWRLLARWPPGDVDVPLAEERPPPPENAVSFVQGRLATLGVQEGGDLALVEVGDLLPDLVTAFGSDDVSLDRLARDFPRVWEHAGARYLLDVSPAAKRVTLDAADARARKANDPKPALVPRFRGFRVLYRRASRTITLR